MFGVWVNGAGWLCLNGTTTAWRTDAASFATMEDARGAMTRAGFADTTDASVPRSAYVSHL